MLRVKQNFCWERGFGMGTFPMSVCQNKVLNYRDTWGNVGIMALILMNRTLKLAVKRGRNAPVRTAVSLLSCGILGGPERTTGNDGGKSAYRFILKPKQGH